MTEIAENLKMESYMSVSKYFLSSSIPGKSRWEDVVMALVLRALSYKLSATITENPALLLDLDTSPSFEISCSVAEKIPVAETDFFRVNRFPKSDLFIKLLLHLLEADQALNPSGPRSALCDTIIKSLLSLLKRVVYDARDKGTAMALANRDVWQELGAALSFIAKTFHTREEPLPPQMTMYALDWWYNSTSLSGKDMDMYILHTAAFNREIEPRDYAAYDKYIKVALLDVYGADKVLARVNAQLRAIRHGVPSGEVLMRLGPSYSGLLRDIELQKCSINQVLCPTLYECCLHYMDPALLDVGTRRQIWIGVADVVMNWFDTVLIGGDGKRKTMDAPLQIYTALSLLLSGGAEFIAYGVCHFALLSESDDPQHEVLSTCSELVYRIRGFVEATHAPLPQHLKGTPIDIEYTKMRTALGLFRDEFRQVWWPALRILKEVDSNEHAHQAQKGLFIRWNLLGNDLGLSEIKEKAEYQKRQDEARRDAAEFCAWVSCRYNNEKPSTRLRLCAGCGEVGYCSRECQKAHWKSGHKQRCQNRIKSQ